MAIIESPKESPEVAQMVTEKGRPICRRHDVADLDNSKHGHLQVVGYFETLVIPVGETLATKVRACDWRGEEPSLHLRPGERLVDSELGACRLHSFGATGPMPPEPDDGGPLVGGHGVAWLQFDDGLKLVTLSNLCASLMSGRLVPFRVTAAEAVPKVGERLRITPQWKPEPDSWGAAVPVGALGAIANVGHDPERGAYVELLFREVREGLVAMTLDEFTTEVRLGAIVRVTVEYYDET